MSIGLSELLATLTDEERGKACCHLVQLFGCLQAMPGVRVLEEYSQVFDMEKLSAHAERYILEYHGTFGELLLDGAELRRILEKAAGDMGCGGFSLIRQGKETNAFTRTTEKGAAKVKRVAGGLVRLLPNNVDDCYITLTDIDVIRGLRASTFQLLDMLTVQEREGVARVRLDKYMELRGLKDTKAARELVKADLETLARAAIHIHDGKGFMECALIADRGIRHGVIAVSFGKSFAELLRNYKPMPYPRLLYRVNTHKNPHAFYLLRRISEHKNMNYTKSNADILSVKTLLDACPEMPKYEWVNAGARQLSKRIIEPFERDMCALSTVLSWEYAEPLPDAVDWETFSNSLVRVKWESYPERQPPRKKSK